MMQVLIFPDSEPKPPSGGENHEARPLRRAMNPTRSVPPSNRPHVEGSGTGVKSKVRVFPTWAKVKLPVPSEFWNALVLMRKSAGLKPVIEVAERIVHEYDMVGSKAAIPATPDSGTALPSMIVNGEPDVAVTVNAAVTLIVL